MSADTPLLDELAKVREELQQTRDRLELLEDRFATDARSPEDRAVTKYIEHIIREDRRKVNARLKKLEGKG